MYFATFAECELPHLAHCVALLLLFFANAFLIYFISLFYNVYFKTVFQKLHCWIVDEKLSFPGMECLKKCCPVASI